jgi:hypothetical protein
MPIDFGRTAPQHESARFAVAGGLCSSALGGLLFALRFAPSLGQRLADSWQPVTHEISANWARGFHLGQFVTYLLCLAAAGIFGLLWMLFWRFALQRAPARTRVIVAASVAACVTVGASLVAPLLGALAVAVLAISTVLTTEATGASERLSTDPAIAGSIVLICESIALAWGLWMAMAPAGDGPIALAVLIVAIIAVIAATYFAGRAGAGLRMRRAAITFLPLLLLPLLGFCRRPGVGWFVAAGLACSALFAALRHRAPPRGLTTLLLIPALWSVAAIGIIPRSMRDLPSINMASHEAQHLGWLNSAFDGRLLGADAGTTYGMLREYLLAAYCYVFGVTVENVRIAHLVLNLAGLMVFLVTAYVLFARRPILYVGLFYAAVFYTPLRCFLAFDRYLAFGWADCLRIFGAMAAVVLTCFVVGKDADNAAPPRGKLLFACGGSIALALLYSQEFGLCAVGAVALAIPVAYAFPRGGRRLRERAWAASRSLGFVASGIAAPVAAVLGFYGYFGKAGLLVKTTWMTLSLAASGVLGSVEFPISAQTFAEPIRLFEVWPDGEPVAQFIVPVAIYVVTACALLVRAFTRPWTVRCTVLFGLLALGASSFRVTLARADIYHLLAAFAPSILCIGALLDEAIDVHVHLHRANLEVGRALAGVLLLGTLVVTERIGGIAHLLDQFAHGTRDVTSVAPYEYPDIPRAGDVYLDGDYQALARFVRGATGPNDRMFTLLNMMDGGELYFICDRPNPTRYDLTAEIFTAAQQHEVLESLKSDPPRLIVGNDIDEVATQPMSVIYPHAGSVVGDEVISYVKEHWTVPKSIGRYTVWMQR